MVEICDACVDQPDNKSLVITKGGKYLRGCIAEHNVRVSGDGRVRGRIVMVIDGARKEVDAGDIASVEKTS